MKRSEVIEKYEDKIIEEMRSAYDYCIGTEGRATEQIWIWDDGEIETICDVKPNTGWLKAKECEDRQLFYVLEVDGVNQGFSVWDTTCEPKPEDEEEAEAMKQELLQEMLDEYDPYVQYNETLEEAKRQEEEAEEDW